MAKQNDKRDDLDPFDITDTEENSSSSSTYYENQPFILDVHEISKENPNIEPTKKIKKIKKKKKNKSQASLSSGSTANSVAPSPAVVEELPREEFFDAHESYHALPENQISNPIAAAALIQAHSEHGQGSKVVDPKAVDPKTLNLKVLESTQSQGQTSAAQKQPSAITKPVTGPE